MKKFVFILLSVFALLSCSKDDGEGERFSIAGEWVQTYHENTTTNSFIGQEDGTYFLFNSDGSFTFFYSGWGAINRTTTGRYTVKGSSLPLYLRLEYGEGETAIIDVSTIGEDGNATFSIDGSIHRGVYKFKRR